MRGFPVVAICTSQGPPKGKRNETELTLTEHDGIQRDHYILGSLAREILLCNKITTYLSVNYIQYSYVTTIASYTSNTIQ